MIPTRLHYRRSLASRITLLTTIAVGVAVAVVSLASYMTVRAQSQRSLDESLRDRASQAADTVLVAQLTTDTIPNEIFGAADVRMILINGPARQYKAADPASDLSVGAQEYAVANGEQDWAARTTQLHGERFRMVTVPTSTPGLALTLAQSMAPEDAMLERVALVSLFFGLAGMISAGLAGWGVAANGLRPVRRLTSAAEEIARTNRLSPIDVEGNDEVARLAGAFNEMLGSLGASRDRQRQLVADASHELRTPLTSLRTNIELLTQAGASERLPAQARKELLADVQAQITEMTTLIGDLVELARDEQHATVLEQVNLQDVVDTAVARVKRRAPFVQFVVDTEQWPVIGDVPGLERAITNLFDNAAKWSPEHGTVTATLRDGVLRVEDEGPGISEEDMPHVFERFYRSPESRAMPGSGLGLSIVANVAERHQGSVRVERAASGGAAFEFFVPQAEDSLPAQGSLKARSQIASAE